MNLKVSQNLPCTLSIKDSKGNPAPVDGIPAWSVTDASLAVVEAAADGMSALVKPLGPMGSFQLQVKADADMGTGGKEIIGVLDIDLAAAEASVMTIAAGDPVDA